MQTTKKYKAMGLKKGTTNNPKGRPKGTPNKTTSELKEWVNNLLDKNKIQFEKDLKAVEPEKRLAIIEKLLQYSLPKQQSISIDAQIAAEYSELEKLLERCPEDVIDRIAEKVEQLNKLNNGQNQESK